MRITLRQPRVRHALAVAGIAWLILQTVIVRDRDELRRELGKDLKGKISPVFYSAGILLAFVDTLIADMLYVLVSLIWLIPDRRIERVG